MTGHPAVEINQDVDVLLVDDVGGGKRRRIGEILQAAGAMALRSIAPHERVARGRHPRCQRVAAHLQASRVVRLEHGGHFFTHAIVSPLGGEIPHNQLPRRCWQPAPVSVPGVQQGVAARVPCAAPGVGGRVVEKAKRRMLPSLEPLSPILHDHAQDMHGQEQER